MFAIKKVTLYSDGACSGNPGPGGYAAIIVYGDAEKVLSGGERHTTNNRMELLAVIEALGALLEPCEVTVVTDSRYVADAIEKGWLWSWRARGWKNSSKQDTPNTDLWQRLVPLLSTHKVSFHWIRGHAGHPYNERCDKLAVEESKKNS